MRNVVHASTKQGERSVGADRAILGRRLDFNHAFLIAGPQVTDAGEA